MAGRRPDATAGHPGRNHLPATGGDADADQAKADPRAEPYGERATHRRQDARPGRHTDRPRIDVSKSRLGGGNGQPDVQPPHEQLGRVDFHLGGAIDR